MPSPAHRALLDDAVRTVGPLLAEAGALALRHFRVALTPDDKGGGHGFDPVTEADREVETLLRERLAARFPGHEIVGEEHGASGTGGAVRWLIDPIDGTRAFISGSPLWGILVGLLVDGEPVAGWMHQPYLRETFAAAGGEAWLERDGERRRLATRPTTELAQATLTCTHPRMFIAPQERAAFERLSARVRLQGFGGDCYGYCLLALGGVDLVVESSLQPYDIVPLIPIVRAAGGVVTDRAGRPPLAGGFAVAAATPELHRRALAILQEEPEP